MPHEVAMDLTARLSQLAKIDRAPGPVVSVYLNTRWADEHHRDRVRLFLKNELRQARRAATGGAATADLDWIEAQGSVLIDQTRSPEANGVALFACEALGLRDVLPVRIPFEDTFVVADAPHLRPLASLAEGAPPALIVFVDTESARLIPLTASGAGDEVALESEVPGRHKRGGWAQLAQSRYQRHIQVHRDQHFEAVAESLVRLTEDNGVTRVVLAGEARNRAQFQDRLPPRAAERVVGGVPAARHDTASALVARAETLLAEADAAAARAAVQAVLTEAAKSRRAVAGLGEVLEAVSRGAVHRLYLLRGLREEGRRCRECGALQRGADPRCRLCGKATEAAELGEAMVDRVVATGGAVDVVDAHPDLARVGGVAARLRYEL